MKTPEPDITDDAPLGRRRSDHTRIGHGYRPRSLANRTPQAQASKLSSTFYIIPDNIIVRWENGSWVRYGADTELFGRLAPNIPREFRPILAPQDK